jgi:hypothetical protein
MWGEPFEPQLDGYPLQVSLPQGVEERRQTILADNTQPWRFIVITSPERIASLSDAVKDEIKQLLNGALSVNFNILSLEILKHYNIFMVSHL